MKRVLNAVLGGCLLVASCAAPKKVKYSFRTISLTWRLWNGTVLTRPLSTPVK